MPRNTVTRNLTADPDTLWKLVGDPSKLPRWWPKVERVDRRDPERFTKWVVSPRGRAVEMHYSLEEAGPGRRTVWRQDLDAGPFARSLRSASEEIRVEQSGDGSRLSLSLERRLRGSARLGAWFVWRGQRRELREAMDAVEERVDG